MVHALVNDKKWDELPKTYLRRRSRRPAAMPTNGCRRSHDAENMPALRRLIAAGSLLKGISETGHGGCRNAAYEVYGELMQKSKHWARVYPEWKKFRDEQFLWFRVAESTYDNYVFFQGRSREKLKTKAPAPRASAAPPAAWSR